MILIRIMAGSWFPLMIGVGLSMYVVIAVPIGCTDTKWVLTPVQRGNVIATSWTQGSL